ncbi:MAG: tryptophan synthase subunit alpha [Gemmatimonadetes bacterium]|nr:tryptophan synthase subunit alpha [Gemmatimonadota bacterium]
MSRTTSSSALSARFEGWRAAGHKALVPYLTAGYPTAAETPDLLDALAAAGADVLELGIPFSDPLADGPTIQRASQRALDRGMTVSGALRLLERFRRSHDHAVVLFTYLNPVLRYGPERFVRDAEAAGADGLLLTDLPVGADPEIEETVEASGLDLIRLIAPTTRLERIREIGARARGFVYYISRTGVTGARDSMRSELADELRALRGLISAPIAVGFGIATPEQAALVAEMADGVVVGSALIDRVDEGGAGSAAAFLASLREAIDGRSA